MLLDCIIKNQWGMAVALHPRVQFSRAIVKLCERNLVFLPLKKSHNSNYYGEEGHAASTLHFRELLIEW